MSGSAQQLTPQQQNMIARQLIAANGLPMVQPVFSQSGINPANVTVLNIPPRNVGLLRGFWITVTGTITNSSGSTALTRTSFGPANLLSQVLFSDLNNNVRHNTAGWHVGIIDAMRKGYPFPGPVSNSTVSGFGANYSAGIQAAPSTIAASGNATVKQTYYLPISYSADDLRGAVYMGVVNATANLQLTFNPAPVVASGDATLAIYSGAAGTLTNVSVTVYQDYIDQLPNNNGAPVLPLLDLSYVYELKNTTLSGINANADFPVPYANFRSFLSTTAVYDNGGTLNAGSDVNYWSLQAANFTNILKVDPFLLSLMARDMINCDPPAGVYYLDHRRKPLVTNQYGNLNLILNASTVNSGAQLLIGYEDFALINNVVGAGSLPGS